MANKPRNFIRYQLRVKGKIVHGGITERPLDERLAEHQQKWPKATIKQVGPKVTEQTALDWEKKKGY